MVIVAVSHVTQGHIYVGFIGGLHAPDVRRWMNTHFTPGENTAPYTLHAVPVASVTLTADGPIAISWRQGSITFERRGNPSSLSGRFNTLHSTRRTYRRIIMTVLDRPIYTVINWSLPLEPVLSLLDVIDGGASTLIMTSVNILQVSHITAPLRPFGDDESSTPPMASNSSHEPRSEEEDQQPQEDDSPRPSDISSVEEDPEERDE